MTSKYTKSAKGQQCQVRIPSICNHNPETVVFAHLNGGGMGMKRADIHGAYCCSACHDELDGRTQITLDNAPSDAMGRIHLNMAFYDAVIRTQEIMIKEGILVL